MNDCGVATGYKQNYLMLRVTYSTVCSLLISLLSPTLPVPPPLILSYPTNPRQGLSLRMCMLFPSA
jgi:hypothetical protein